MMLPLTHFIMDHIATIIDAYGNDHSSMRFHFTSNFIMMKKEISHQFLDMLMLIQKLAFKFATECEEA